MKIFTGNMFLDPHRSSHLRPFFQTTYEHLSTESLFRFIFVALWTKNNILTFCRCCCCCSFQNRGYFNTEYSVCILKQWLAVIKNFAFILQHSATPLAVFDCLVHATTGGCVYWPLNHSHQSLSRLCNVYFVLNHASACFMGTQRIVSVEYLFGRPVIASHFRLGKCHVEFS